MIGAGIFVLTGIAAGKAGPALAVAFVLNGVVTSLTAMSYAELGSCFPEAGGGYLWVKQGLPGPNGFLAGWMSWFAHVVACSLYSLGFGSYLLETLSSVGLVPELSPATAQVASKVAAVAVVLLFTYINYRGAAETGAAEGFVTIAKLAVLGLFIASGLVATFTRPDWKANFTPFMPMGGGGVLMAMGLTFIAFEGYEIIAQCGEEVRNPKRNIPRAVFLSLVLTVPIYVLVAIVCIGGIRTEGGIATWQWLRDLREPELGVVEAARQFMVGGPGIGAALLLIGGLFSTVSALNATVYSSSRVSYAMGRDHNLPTAFARIHARRKTPHIAIMASAAIIIIMALALPIEKVAAAADLMFIFLFLQVDLALLALRRRRPDLDRGFRVPLARVTAFVAVLTLMVLAVYLLKDHPVSFAYAFGWIFIGAVIYYAYARPRERAARVSKVVFAKVHDARPEYTAIVPLANPAHVPNLMAIASAAAKRQGGSVVALAVVQVPAPTPLDAAVPGVESARRVLDLAVAEGKRWDVPVEAVVRVGRDISNAILDTIEQWEANLLVMGWRGYTRDSQRVLGTTLDRTIRRANCDIAVLKAGEPLPGVAGDAGQVIKILCPTTGSRHGRLGMDLAAGLVALIGGHTHYLHVIPPDGEPAAGVENMQKAGIDVEVVHSTNFQGTVVREAQSRDLVVMGAARGALLPQLLFGTKTESVARATEKAVLLVKRHPGLAAATLREMFRPLEPDEIAAYEEHQ